MALRKRNLLWTIAVGIAFLPTGSCRPASVCVRTVKATCACDDPYNPEIKTCTAAADIDCELTDGPKADPCQVAPCCLMATDGGADLSTF